MQTPPKGAPADSCPAMRLVPVLLNTIIKPCEAQSEMSQSVQPNKLYLHTWPCSCIKYIKTLHKWSLPLIQEFNEAHKKWRVVSLYKQQNRKNKNCNIDHRLYKRWRQFQCLKSDARSTKYLITACFLMIIRGRFEWLQKDLGSYRSLCGKDPLPWLFKRFLVSWWFQNPKEGDSE